ncbi:serine hydrolase [Microlunatus sp. GCM10028923]|uniref:serine hydrolase n=1 Tax=Microlunatus sp. GCM10028923 TaxID=3273400 RepID=UPI00361A018A
MFTRRRFLIAGSLAIPGALAFGSAPAAAEPRRSSDPEAAAWLDWIAGHRDSVSVAAIDGSGGRIRHLDRKPRVLASTIKVVHLAAYATAVSRGLLDPAEPIRLGDWDARHPYVSDGRAHFSALTALGIPCNEYGIADDPDRTVPLDTLVAAMIDFSDNAATDYLRGRLGDPALHRAAAAGGWHRPDTRSLQGEVLQLILPEHAAPVGAPTALRRVIGDHLAQRFIHDLTFRKQVWDRIPEMPATSEEQWPWTQGHAHGTAAELAGLHHAVAAGTFRPRSALPVIRGHLERGLASLVPEGAAAVGFKGGSLPRTVNIGLNVRWQDGRTGVLALMLTGLSDDQVLNGGPALIRLGIGALSHPDQFATLAKSLTPNP